MHTQSYSIQFEAVLHPLAGAVVKGDALTRRVGGYIVANTANLAISSTGRVDCVALMDGSGGGAIHAAFDGQLFPDVTGIAASGSTGFADVDANGRLTATLAQGSATIGTRGKDGSVTLACGVGSVVSSGTGVGDWTGPTVANVVERITGLAAEGTPGGYASYAEVTASGLFFLEGTYENQDPPGHYVAAYSRTIDGRARSMSLIAQSAFTGASTFLVGGGFDFYAGRGADVGGTVGSGRFWFGGPLAVGADTRGLTATMDSSQMTVAVPLQATKFIIGTPLTLVNNSYNPLATTQETYFTNAATNPSITAGSGVPVAVENAGSVYFRLNGIVYATSGGGVWTLVGATATVFGGDLTQPVAGTQRVVALTGAAGSIPIATTGNIFTWAAGTTAPGWMQTQATSGAGAAMMVQTQASAAASGLNGGDFVLRLGKSEPVNTGTGRFFIQLADEGGGAPYGGAPWEIAHFKRSGGYVASLQLGGGTDSVGLTSCAAAQVSSYPLLSLASHTRVDIGVISDALGVTATAAFKNCVDATGNEAALSWSYTTNKATSGDDSGFQINWTNTASPGVSRPYDLLVGGVRKFQVRETGAVLAGGANVPTTTTCGLGLAEATTLMGRDSATGDYELAGVSTGGVVTLSGTAAVATYVRSGGNVELLVTGDVIASPGGAERLRVATANITHNPTTASLFQVGGVEKARVEAGGVSINGAGAYGSGVGVLCLKEATTAVSATPGASVTISCEGQMPTLNWKSVASGTRNKVQFSGIPNVPAVTEDAGRVLKLVLIDDGGTTVTKYIKLWDIA